MSRKLLRELEDLLVREFSRQIRTSPPKHEICIVHLLYFDNSGPYTYFRTEDTSTAYRDKVCSVSEYEGLSTIWDASELRDDLGHAGDWGIAPDDPDISDQDKATLENVFEYLCAKESRTWFMWPYCRTVLRACKRLNREDWSDVPNLSDDFVIVAGEGCGHSKFEPYFSLTRSKYRMLRRKGFIGPGIFMTY
ncbi:MAG: hypothetical protein AAF497_16295, partial [Planctomycetota bacterium]